MNPFELAQLNIATLRAPLDSPLLVDFVANLDRINALAEHSPGFVWRLETEEGNATALRPFDANTLVNMSVWADVTSLRNFVYRTAHAEILVRRREWFELIAEASVVLWWVPQGHRPTIAEARQRLDALRAQGPRPDAFDLRTTFPAPDTSAATSALRAID